MITATAATLALAFCLCLNVGHCRTIAQGSSSKVVRLQMIPRDSPLATTSNRSSEASFLRGLTESDRVLSAIRRSQARAAALQRRFHALPTAQPGGYEAPVSPGDAAFLLELTIGSPSLRYHAILDPASDLTWTQCLPCNICYNQATLIFNPNESTTYKPCSFKSPQCLLLPQGQSWSDSNNRCIYAYIYGLYGSASTAGVLATESFTLSGAPFKDVAFGCGHDNNGKAFDGASGIVGFGRGPLSFPSQFANSVGSDGVAFAYCLVSGTTGSSPLWLGPDAVSKFPSGANLSSTPFIMNQVKNTYFYYVSVTGIDVAGTAVDIPSGAFDIDSGGERGLIIDSGSTLTYLENQTYNSLISLLNSSIGLSTVDGSSLGLGLCYNSSAASSENATFPTVTLTFEGGAKMQWAKENYIIERDNLVCAALLPSDGMSVIGNLAQRNFFILHDTSANKLSFAPTQCDSITN